MVRDLPRAIELPGLYSNGRRILDRRIVDRNGPWGQRDRFLQDLGASTDLPDEFPFVRSDYDSKVVGRVGGVQGGRLVGAQETGRGDIAGRAEIGHGKETAASSGGNPHAVRAGPSVGDLQKTSDGLNPP